MIMTKHKKMLKNQMRLAITLK
jgi:hypothetical protein